MSTKYCANLERETVAAFLLTLAQGDVGILPAGTATWTAEVIWNAPPDVTLKGAGDLTIRGGNDVTIINDNIVRSGYDSSLFSIQLPATGWVRVCGITFRGTGDSDKLSSSGRVRIFAGNVAINQILFDHCHFDTLLYTGLASYGIERGLYKECKFTDCSVRQYGVGNGDVPWNEATDLGTSKFVFIEDCDNVFNYAAGVLNDMYFGARVVIRYCDLTNSGWETHPTGGSGRARGARAWEFYRNTLRTTMNCFNTCFISSGTGVMHHNTFEAGANYSNMATLHAMRRDNSTYTQTATPNGWGFAGTSFNGVGSNWDTNATPATGSRNIDQVGAGVGDLLGGEFPNCVNVTRGNIGSTDPNCHPHQAIDSAYFWENDWVNPGMGGSKFANYNPEIIVENTDYYANTAKPGYVEYEYPHPFYQEITGIDPEDPDVDPEPPDPGPDPEPAPVVVEVTGTARFEFMLPAEMLSYLRSALNDKEN